MANFQNVPSSFFMFYVDDFSTKLGRIPLKFVNNYEQFLDQATLELKTHSARSWAVKTEKENDGKWFITNGWSKFVTDNHLVYGNLLTFCIVGESALEVSIFRKGSVLEEPAVVPPPPSAANLGGESRPTATKNWRFVKKLKTHHFYTPRLDIPAVFAWGTGISMKPEIKLEIGGSLWPVKITDRTRNVFSMTGGWTEFVKANNLQPEIILLFEFVPGSRNVVKAVVLGRQVGEKMLREAKKGGMIMD